MIELRAGALRLALAPEIGGAVAAFERAGVPLLRPASSAALVARDVRGLASYPLVPFSNRIAHALLRWAGATYPLARYIAAVPHAIHGNGWQRAWRVIAHEPMRAAFELEHDAAGARAAEWPFAYRAQQSFVLAPDALTMTLAIANAGAAAFPVGLGWHPFFPRDAATELAFGADGMWETDATQLPTRLAAIPPGLDFATPRPIGGAALDNCFTGWRPPAIVRWPAHALSVALSAGEGCRHLVVYVPPGADYLAVEPVTHMTDGFNRAAAGERATGTRVLGPGESFSCTMRLSVLPLR